MILLESILDGIADIRTHMGRTMLQLVGVILGVASIVATFPLAAAGKEQSQRFYKESGGIAVPSTKKQKTCLKISDTGCPLAFSADGAKKTFQDRINGDVAEIPDKKSQPASGGQGVRSCFNPINNVAFFIASSHSSAYENLPPMGFG